MIRFLFSLAFSSLSFVNYAHAQGSDNIGWISGRGYGPFPSGHAACLSEFYWWAGQYWQAGFTWPWFSPPVFTSPTVADCRYAAPFFTEPQSFMGAFYQAACPVREVPQTLGGCGPTDFDKNAEPVCAATSNPINIGTGNKYWSETDWKSQGSTALAFRRHYNALIIRDVIALAANWTHTYTRWIEPFGSTRVFIYRSSGRKLTANLTDATITNGRQRWTLNQTDSEQLFKIFDVNSVAIGWELKHVKDGALETYGVNGRLTATISHSAYVQTMVYSDGTAGPNGGYVLDAVGNPTSTLLPAGLLIRVTDSFNRAIQFGYDIQSRLAKMTDTQGGTYRYGFDLRRNLTAVVYPDGKSRFYFYNEPQNVSTASLPNALTGMVNELGNRFATYRYDASGRATGSNWWADTNQTLAVQSVNLVFGSSVSTTVTDALGSMRSYTFAATNGLVRSTGQSQPAGSGCGPSSSAITYDANANVTSRIDFNNNKICYAYDLSRNLETKRVEGLTGSAVCSTALSSPPAGARIISTQCHPDWRLETRIAEPKKLTTITYNGQGATCAPSTVLVDGKPAAVICTRTEQATTDETGAAGFAATVTGTPRTWRYTYTTYGRVLTATDPNNRTTSTTYHPDNDPDLGKRGNVASITNAANHTTFITDYNPHGQPTRIVDPNGVVTVLTYDPRMRLTSRTVGNEATVFGYDPVGQMTSVNLPDGARLTYTYDAAHRLTAINDHRGNRIDYTLDAMGNRIAEQMKDPGGVLVGNIARVIDALNRTERITGAGQ